MSLREDCIESIEEAETDNAEVRGYLLLKQDVEAIKAAIQEYLISSETTKFEHDGVNLTMVQAHKRFWNPDKLKQIIGKAMFIKVSNYTIDPAKIDELVKAGKLEENEIAPAFEEVANKPYLRISYAASDGGEEAERLAEALGV